MFIVFFWVGRIIISFSVNQIQNYRKFCFHFWKLFSKFGAWSPLSFCCEYYSLQARHTELTSKCIIIIWSLFKILGGDSEEEVEQGNKMTSDDISDTR